MLYENPYVFDFMKGCLLAEICPTCQKRVWPVKTGYIESITGKVIPYRYCPECESEVPNNE